MVDGSQKTDLEARDELLSGRAPVESSEPAHHSLGRFGYVVMEYRGLSSVGWY